ncbi:hypothetical protein CEQ21_04690 [Niallia circulans]|uniref:Bacterial EndoU nuclease domain-containing protein n=1 Tax=Niallia circulans TaxID=1397 RepID=A0A553STB8_NIACI|nr:CdiA family toxin C-terminal domain-containing protein [Niallia circulans]TRZ40240.1 hypothetical protein CEQ21_04690 [Niallia circulans]
MNQTYLYCLVYFLDRLFFRFYPTQRYLYCLSKDTQPKTVYDPSIVSDEQLIEWGKEAMKNGEVNGRVVDGIASNGVRFRGFLNLETNEITNFFPTIE